MDKRYVIVIGRQYGSGGREIGLKLSKKLGIPLYDKEILATIAEEKGIEHERIVSMDENIQGNRLRNIGMQAGKALLGPGYLYETDHRSIIGRDHIFEWQSDLIKRLAAEGPCIIIGRCADFILKDDPGLISLFITAPFKARLERIERLHPEYPKENYESHAELVRKTDRIRSTYYNYHTDREWGNVRNYHLIVDSTKLGIDGTVEMLADYVKHAVG